VAVICFWPGCPIPPLFVFNFLYTVELVLILKMHEIFEAVRQVTN
jgi:hypothetical protein